MRSLGFGFLILAVLIGVALPCPSADEKARAFPSPGTTVPRSFSPLVINGQWKNPNGDPEDRYHSVICHFGLKPVVLVFARDPQDDAVFDFLKRLEAKVIANKNIHLGGCAIFLVHDDKRDRADLLAKDLIKAVNDQEKLVKLLKEKAATAGLKQVLVGITNKEGPRDFHIQPRADITVIVYNKYRVVDSKDYKRGEFDDKAAGQTLKKIDALAARIRDSSARAKKGEEDD